MARSVVRRISTPRKRKAFDGPALAVAAVIAAFALIGVISAGSFLAGQFSSSTSPKAHSSSSSRLAVNDVTRARQQAAAVLSAANAASRQIINSATSNARQKAARILATAHRQAEAIVAQAKVSAAPTAVTTAPQTTTNYTPPVYTAPVTSTGPSTSAEGGTSSGVSQLPNLSTLPTSWRVVAYSASFGSGPGAVGGVSILNRGSRAYSGTVIIRYNTGGSSAASFSGLAPGQNIVLPLSGRLYRGGGYRIVVNVG